MGLIPGEDQYSWVVERSYAVDAAAAVVYALSCRKSGDVQEAVWAAQTAYSALDRFVIEVFDLPVIDKSDEPRVLSHYLIQAEFSRQQRDLREVEAETDFVGLAERLRTRAKAESATVFSRASE
jgi:hypothetical protein